MFRAKGPTPLVISPTMAAEMKPTLLVLALLAATVAGAQVPGWLQKKLKPIVHRPVVTLRVP